MTPTRLLCATCSILALAGCGTTESSPPAGGTPPAAGTTVSDPKPATAASDKVEVEAKPGPVTSAAAPTIPDASGPRPLLVTARQRLTDQEVRDLLESIEKKRSAFEAALDIELKNSTIKGDRFEVKTNEFFDDLQDQVARARERFSSNYSASSEVLLLLNFATRLDAWVSMQPAGFRGSKEWGVLATDFRRLAAAYNSALLRRGQPGLGAQARRLNDAELVTVAANIEKNMDGFRHAYDSALAANADLTPARRQTAIKNVDAMKYSAQALHAAVGNKQKGVAEANALLKGSAAMIDVTRKLPPNSAAAAAWAPVGEELSKVGLAYEVTPLR